MSPLPRPASPAPAARFAAIGIAALLALAPAVRADGLNFAWSQCWPEGGLTGQSFACNTNTGTRFVMIGSLVRALPLPQGLKGIEFKVDISVGATNLPAWWHFEPGGCRELGLGVSADFSIFIENICLDPWQGFGVLTSTWEVPSPALGGTRSARVHGFITLSDSDAFPLLAGHEYRMFWLRLYPYRSTGFNSCSGCFNSAQIELTSITLFEGAGGTTQETVTATASNKCIVWQGTGPCAVVAARNHTWGAIKGLYR